MIKVHVSFGLKLFILGYMSLVQSAQCIGQPNMLTSPVCRWSAQSTRSGLQTLGILVFFPPEKRRCTLVLIFLPGYALNLFKPHTFVTYEHLSFVNAVKALVLWWIYPPLTNCTHIRYQIKPGL